MKQKEVTKHIGGYLIPTFGRLSLNYKINVLHLPNYYHHDYILLYRYMSQNNILLFNSSSKFYFGPTDGEKAQGELQIRKDSEEIF